MSVIVGAVLVASMVWMLLPMAEIHVPYSWRSTEYWLVLVLFGFAGIGLLLGIVDSSNPAIAILRFALPSLVGVAVALMNLAQGAIIRPAGLMLLLVFVPMVAFALEDKLLMPFISLAVLAPAIFTPRIGYSAQHIYAGMRDSVRLVLGVLAFFMVMLPDVTTGQCRGDKCSIWGMALGPLGTGNALGVFLAFVAVFSVLLARNMQTALISIVASGILVDATSSRSAMVSWGVGILSALLWRCVKDRWRSLLLAAAGSTLSFAAFMAFYPWQPREFTGRANLWLVAREIFMENPFFGLGPSYWVRQDRTSYVDSNYATHNLLLEVLVSVGLFGALAFFISVVLLVRSASNDVQAMSLVLVTGWIASSVLEVTAAPGRLYLVPGILVLLYLHGQSSFAASAADQPLRFVMKRSAPDSLSTPKAVHNSQRVTKHLLRGK